MTAVNDVRIPARVAVEEACAVLDAVQRAEFYKMLIMKARLAQVTAEFHAESILYMREKYPELTGIAP